MNAKTHKKIHEVRDRNPDAPAAIPASSQPQPNDLSGNLILETNPGDCIEDVCKRATALAINKRQSVSFEFNGKTIIASPKDSWKKVLRKWNPNYDPKKAAIYPDTAREALRRWDAGQSVFTVEMGGLGPGYEQAIQILVFEIIREHIGQHKPLPKPGTSANGWMDSCAHRVSETAGGFSGAQVGAAKNLAYYYLKDGYAKTLESFKEKDKDRTIQVSNFWPKAPSE